MGVLAAAGIAAVGAIAASEIGANATKKASDQSAALTAQQNAIAKEQWETFKTNFLPLEKQLTAEVAPIGGAQDQDRAAADAESSVVNAGDAASKALARNNALYNINPASPNATSNAATIAQNTGIAAGGAGNQAKIQARNTGIGLRRDVVGLGMGLPASTSAMLGSAQQGANQSNLVNTMLTNQATSNAAGAIAPFVRIAQNGIPAFWGSSTPTGTSNTGWVGTGSTVEPPALQGFGGVGAAPYARGGIVRKPTVAQLGETGKEAVLNPGATAMLGEKKITALNRAGMQMGVVKPATTADLPDLGEYHSDALNEGAGDTATSSAVRGGPQTPNVPRSCRNEGNNEEYGAPAPNGSKPGVAGKNEGNGVPRELAWREEFAPTAEFQAGAIQKKRRPFRPAVAGLSAHHMGA